MPVAKHSIVFARLVPSELNIVTTENNNVIDLGLCCQIKSFDGTDAWQRKNGSDLGWGDFTKHFYGGGEKDFGISQVAGTQLTMIGVEGEYANGDPQTGSALTHLADAGTASTAVSGVSILNDVIDSVVYDLGLPHEAWDSCSYMNVVDQLNEVHTLHDCMRVSGKLQQSCSLKMEQLVHEIASNYDESMGITAAESTSAVKMLYSTGESDAIGLAVGTNDVQRHDLVLSVMFKNSTPGVRNVEFRIHLHVGDVGASTLTALCAASRENFPLNGTQV
jgi:hypothetical protein